MSTTVMTLSIENFQFIWLIVANE